MKKIRLRLAITPVRGQICEISEVARPDMRNISYLGHSVTWDKSGILGANHLLGPSQDSARALYLTDVTTQ